MLTAIEADTGRTLARIQDAVPAWARMLEVIVRDPWRREMDDRRTAVIEAEVSCGLPAAVRSSGRIEVRLTPRGAEGPARVRRYDAPPADLAVRLPADGLDWGAYELEAVFLDEDGGRLAEYRTTATVLPGRPRHVRPMNNLVSELLDCRDRGLDPTAPQAFMNPRDGWCLVRREGEGEVMLDGEAIELDEWNEALRRLPAGRHEIRGGEDTDNLIVRAVPATAYTNLRADSHVKPYRPYSLERLYEPIFRNCSTIVCGGVSPETLAVGDHDRWTVLHNSSIGALLRNDPVTVEDALRQWRNNPACKYERADGIIFDELLGGHRAITRTFAASLAVLAEEEIFAGKDFWVWGGGLHTHPEGCLLLKVLHEAGWRYCPEAYQPEMPTLARARWFINRRFPEKARGRRLAVPTAVRTSCMTLGYLSQPPEFLTVQTGVDNLAFLDMQMQSLADGDYQFGTAGVMFYKSSYCDQETLIWGGRLMRHYALEGNTERLSDRPYRPDHLKNGDFRVGTVGWTLEPAREGSIRPDAYEGFGWLQGRYPRSPLGDTFLVTRREQGPPNRFRQEITGLESGRLYSLRMISGDHRELLAGKSTPEVSPVRIEIEGGEVLQGPRENFDTVVPSLYAMVVGPFNRKNRYYYTYHWRVFRAEGPTAQLVVCDAPAETGEELLFNYIEVLPYDQP
jgi:hypothetical protein